MSNPYKTKWKDGKPHQLHRLIMEEHIGRELRRDEWVHHINEDKHDNRLENLVIVSPYDHVQIHKRKYPREYKCPVCGRTFVRLSTRYGDVVTCSKKCMGEWFKMNSTSKKPIVQYSLDGRQVKKWGSISEAANELDVSVSSISLCLTGKSKTSHGYRWSYL